MVKEKNKINVESNLNRLSWLDLSVTRAPSPETTDFFFIQMPMKTVCTKPETIKRNHRPTETKQPKRAKWINETVIREATVNKS